MSSPVLSFDGDSLRELRSSRGLSREQIAIAIGGTSQQVALYERGGSVPPTSVLGALAGVLDVPIERLFNRRVA